MATVPWNHTAMPTAPCFPLASLTPQPSTPPWTELTASLCVSPRRGASHAATGANFVEPRSAELQATLTHLLMGNTPAHTDTLLRHRQ